MEKLPILVRLYTIHISTSAHTHNMIHPTKTEILQTNTIPSIHISTWWLLNPKKKQNNEEWKKIELALTWIYHNTSVRIFSRRMFNFFRWNLLFEAKQRNKATQRARDCRMREREKERENEDSNRTDDEQNEMSIKSLPKWKNKLFAWIESWELI